MIGNPGKGVCGQLGDTYSHEGCGDDNSMSDEFDDFEDDDWDVDVWDHPDNDPKDKKSLLNEEENDNEEEVLSFGSLDDVFRDLDTEGDPIQTSNISKIPTTSNREQEEHRANTISSLIEEQQEQLLPPAMRNTNSNNYSVHSGNIHPTSNSDQHDEDHYFPPVLKKNDNNGYDNNTSQKERYSRFIKRITQKGYQLKWHTKQQHSHRYSPPLTILIKLEVGATSIITETWGPRLEWRMNGYDTSDETNVTSNANHNNYRLDLFDIISISSALEAFSANDFNHGRSIHQARRKDLLSYPFVDPPKSFFVDSSSNSNNTGSNINSNRTADTNDKIDICLDTAPGSSYLMEASSEEEMMELRDGLIQALATCSYNVVAGNDTLLDLKEANENKDANSNERGEMENSAFTPATETSMEAKNLTATLSDQEINEITHMLVDIVEEQGINSNTTI